VASGSSDAAMDKQKIASSPSPAVEFFPEGGELIAGIPNRIYFRARDSQGQAVPVEGQVLDREGKVQTMVKTHRAAAGEQETGLGVFTLTPRAGQSYSFQTMRPQ